MIDTWSSHNLSALTQISSTMLENMNATASTTRTTCNRCTTTQRSTAQYSTSFSKDRVIMLNLANNGFAMKRITLCSTFPLQIISCIFNKCNLLSVHVQTFIVCFPSTFVYILLIFLELLWLKIFNWICIKINIFFSLFCLLLIGLENIRVLFFRKKRNLLCWTNIVGSPSLTHLQQKKYPKHQSNFSF